MSKNSPDPSTARAEGCFHCGLPVRGAGACRGDILGKPRDFCCSGCFSVCQVIHEVGLTSFYERLEKREVLLAPPPDAPSDMDQYDLDEVQADFVEVLSNGVCQTQLMVEGIHCAACVWLIEKALSGMAGVEKAEVNLVHHRMLLQWQPERLNLAQVIRRLAALGYAAVPFNLEHAEGHVRDQNRRMLFRMGFAGFGAMNIMWLSIALYAGAFSGMSRDYQHFFHWISFAIATPVLIYSGGPILLSAWNGLRYGRLGMDLPIALGALVTYGYSLWQTWQGGLHVYFDTVVTFLFVILVGRYLELLARRNAASATLRLLELQPRMATRLRGEGEERISVRQLRVGDHLRIRPGDKVPADGVVLEGESHLDESMLTGETKAVHKRIGSCLTGGTVNGEASLVMRVEMTGEETVLARIIHLVESAQNAKAPIQRLADRIVPYFVGATLTLALLTFLYWWSMDLDTALLAATSVLIITCPCALALATPMAIAVSAGVAARQGVLIRKGEALEGLSEIDHVVMDKTGTLTEGKLAVVEVIADTASRQRCLQLAAALERHDSHPLAQAICRAAEAEEIGFLESHAMQWQAGLGIGGVVQWGDGSGQVWLGNRRLMAQCNVVLDKAAQDVCKRVEASMGVAVCVALDGNLLGILHLQDRLRVGAKALVQQLGQLGISISVLTGDSLASAKQLQASLSTDGTLEVLGELRPEDKLREIELLQQRGHCVLMVGDGINDAPALALADMGMAMGSGTDVSMECSDLVLMGSDLQKIIWALALGKRTLRTIRQNLMLSLAYNLLLVPMAMLAYVTPVFAALAMPLSSLAVIVNAMLIRHWMKV